MNMKSVMKVGENTGMPLRVAITGCGAFLALLLAVNIIRTELDPTWHFISEYEIGRFGWLMQLAFLSFGAAHFGLAKRLWASFEGLLGRFAVLLISIAGVGLILGGLFKSDAMLTPAGEGTTTGLLHNLGGGLGIAMPLAVVVVTIMFRRKTPAKAETRLIVPLAILAVAAAVTTMIAFAAYLSASGGVIEPGMPLGIFNRLEIVTYAAWFLAVAFGLASQEPQVG